MGSLYQLFRKEVSDHVSSRRFGIFFFLVYLAGLTSAFFGVQGLSSAISRQEGVEFIFLRLYTAFTGVAPPFIFFVSFFGPILGIAFGFDAINREQASGSLARLLSQPIFRDAVINSKFLASLAVASLMLGGIVLIIGGMGVMTIGVLPTIEEVLRTSAFLGVSIVYVALWIAVSMLFSIVLRRTSTSALASLTLWIFLSFFMFLVAALVASVIVPTREPLAVATPELIAQQEGLRLSVLRLSPSALFEEAAAVLMNPGIRAVGLVIIQDITGIIPNPISFDQSMLLIVPDVVALVAGMTIIFAVSYTVFMKQEVRAA